MFLSSSARRHPAPAACRPTPATHRAPAVKPRGGWRVLRREVTVRCQSSGSPGLTRRLEAFGIDLRIDFVLSQPGLRDDFTVHDFLETARPVQSVLDLEIREIETPLDQGTP